MKIHLPKCEFCGNEYQPEVSNPNQKYCQNCSDLRKELASAEFGERVWVISEDGKYILSKRVDADWYYHNRKVSG